MNINDYREKQRVEHIHATLSALEQLRNLHPDSRHVDTFCTETIAKMRTLFSEVPTTAEALFIEYVGREATDTLSDQIILKIAKAKVCPVDTTDPSVTDRIPEEEIAAATKTAIDAIRTHGTHVMNRTRLGTYHISRKWKKR